MKKALIIIIGIIASLWTVLSLFSGYNSNHLMSNEASFEVFVDSNTINIYNYLNLQKDSFDREEYELICLLPVEISGFKAKFVKVRTDIENIDCDAKFEKERYIQYEPYELKGTNFELILVKKNANLMFLDTPAADEIILARKIFSFNYSKGKVNRLIISGNGISEHCN